MGVRDSLSYPCRVNTCTASFGNAANRDEHMRLAHKSPADKPAPLSAAVRAQIRAPKDAGDVPVRSPKLPEPEFEVFTARMTRQSRTPTVALYARTHIFSMNRAAFEALGEPKFLEIVWDKRQRLVGLRAQPVKTPAAYVTRPASAKEITFTVTAKSFVKWAGIEDPKYARRYPARMLWGRHARVCGRSGGGVGVSTCRFVPSAKTGKSMILDAKPAKGVAVVAAGSVPDVYPTQSLDTQVASVVDVYTDHHVTCPDAAAWKGKTR
jgi:hypothetical protein